ncbi:MAG: Txe/YoeB family addiction module toxin [Treponema sp.]|mgnify:CR=1 FL=1|nr:Txe/YoeB family addiction module toxin [Treponema sp.]MBO7163278.1 Txe/YoeB family addiction module toxin [Spirochaetaceae bacterium]
MSRIMFTEIGFSHYIYWQTQDKKTLQKINKLLKSISREGPLEGEGKPERLKHKEGEYSRRIDSENRLVYEFSEETITVKACRGHYEE